MRTISGRVVAHARQRGPLQVLGSCLDWGARFALGSVAPSAALPGGFVHDGAAHDYTRHRYHYTWLNERAVEVAIAADALARVNPGAVLEVGNVLAHYQPVAHRVVDKYEAAPGVENVDVLDVTTDRPLDLVITISTLEHVGFDEPVQDPDKVGRSVDHLRSLLAPGGRLLATVPVGYNPSLDDLLRGGELSFTRLSALRRAGRSNRWAQVPLHEIWDAPYDRLLATASGIVVAEAGGLP